MKFSFPCSKCFSSPGIVDDNTHGKTNDGVDVAVKVLSAESKQGDREFMSELASLSNIPSKSGQDARWLHRRPPSNSCL
ncbi:putative serine/threonine-protein kinase [Prunus yedoensis var. nudiflora]|uniref:Putative serine/threonine-protein kinase n=1 Tax=Prunus yedoensis var. nudiflora TaxID=2094558 RepID=A0A314YUR5_PRUYE|nr:putative serine/threonine-protein kinase [Prunus yedoensis var. nudiflora]